MNRLTRATLASLFAALAASLTAQGPPKPVDASVTRLQLLVDTFHHAMPQDPSDLRRPEVRREIAAVAIPAIRELDTWMVARPSDPGNLVRSAELAVYALALGDARYSPRTTDKAPDVPTRLRTAAAGLLTAADAAQRQAAVTTFAQALTHAAEEGQFEPLATGSALAVLRAAALEAAEADVLAAGCAGMKAPRELFAAAAKDASTDVRRLVGKPFELSGKRRDGTAFSTASLRGKVVLVDFWASWCAPCKKLLPEIAALRQQFGEQGLEVVGISCDNDRLALDDFLAAHPQDAWPQLFDADKPGWHALATSMGIKAIPRILLIDRRGVLRSGDAAKDLAKRVAELIAERG